VSFVELEPCQTRPYSTTIVLMGSSIDLLISNSSLGHLYIPGSRQEGRRRRCIARPFWEEASCRCAH
jgi:hypothetical protein